MDGFDWILYLAHIRGIDAVTYHQMIEDGRDPFGEDKRAEKWEQSRYFQEFNKVTYLRG